MPEPETKEISPSARQRLANAKTEVGEMWNGISDATVKLRELRLSLGVLNRQEKELIDDAADHLYEAGKNLSSIITTLALTLEGMPAPVK